MNIFKIFKKQNYISLKTKKYGLVYHIPIAAPAHNDKNDFYFSITSMIKDEGPYLEEWIEFHRSVGCEHFIIYDNDSTDDTVKILQKYIQSNIVTLIPWPRFCTTHSLQMLAYSHALALMGGRTRWLCFIDLDEFLFPTETDDLRAALVEFENEPAVGVYWSMFGTSDHKSKPQGLVIENYTWRMPYPMESNTTPNQEQFQKKRGFESMFKSIVQPTRVISTLGAHTFRTDRFPVLAVDGSWNEIRRYTKRVLAEKFQLNHYISKSQEEWNFRLERGGMEGIDLSKRKQKMFDAIESDPIKDTAILRFLPGLKARLRTE